MLHGVRQKVKRVQSREADVGRCDHLVIPTVHVHMRLGLRVCLMCDSLRMAPVILAG